MGKRKKNARDGKCKVWLNLRNCLQLGYQDELQTRLNCRRRGLFAGGDPCGVEIVHQQELVFVSEVEGL